MSVPVGITVPKMLPITGTWALPFAVYFISLGTRVSMQRIQAKKPLGDISTTESTDDPLYKQVRSHANFCENVPFALLLASVVELNGGDRRVLSGSLAALLVFRILHAELGLLRPGSMAIGRGVGTIGSLAFVGGMAGYAAFLVKGYWGF